MSEEDPFALVAEPTRRRILDQLVGAERSVGELVSNLEMSQPAVSRHLKLLREGGLVTSRVEGQRRIYRVQPEQFRALDRWLDPYRRLWTRHLDALERHLDQKEKENA